MLKLLFGKEDVLSFERTYPAPVDAVWDAVTRPDAVREWWGPEKTVVTDCSIDAQPPHRLLYDARSWVEGERDTTTIEHVNELVLADAEGATSLSLTITVSKIGSGAKMAAVGMKYGYKQYLDKLGAHLSR